MPPTTEADNKVQEDLWELMKDVEAKQADYAKIEERILSHMAAEESPKRVPIPVILNKPEPELPPRTCGECSLCCKLLGVASLKKPQGKWCDHCKPGLKGCKVYDQEDRPSECQTFQCIWLQSRPQDIPDDWRPDLLKLIFSVTKAQGIIAVYVDKGYRSRLKRPDVIKTMENLVAMGHRVVVLDGERASSLEYQKPQKSP